MYYTIVSLSNISPYICLIYTPNNPFNHLPTPSSRPPNTPRQSKISCTFLPTSPSARSPSPLRISASVIAPLRAVNSTDAAAGT